MAYLPGKFVWFELETKNFDGAAKFYGELFGWKTNSVSMGGEEYRLLSKGEQHLGGLVPLEGAHPRWLSYVSVDNVDETVKKAKNAGGKIIKEAIDVPTIGRHALVSDPQGGLLYAFRAEKEDAPDRETTHGDWYWNELWANDAEQAVAFYRECFGFEAKEMEMPGMKYFVLERGGVPRAGIFPAPKPGIPTHWLPYVRVDRVDELVQRAKKLGGEVLAEPQDVPTVGRFAVLKDPDGAAIAVIQPAPR